MYQCELLSVQKSTADAETLRGSSDEIASKLRKEGAELNNTIDIKADPKKLANTINKLLTESDNDLFIIANALYTTDNSSFSKLFCRTVTSIEDRIQAGVTRKKTSVKLKVFSIGDTGNGFKGYCFFISGKRFIFLPYASLTGKGIAELICDSAAKADEVIREKAEKYPEGVAYYGPKKTELDDPELLREPLKDKLAPPKKQGFLRSFIPLRSDTKKQRVRKIIVLIAMVAFIVALAYVIEFFIIGPMRNDAVTSEIQTIAYGRTGDGSADELGPEQDWDALKEINDEIVGWVKIPDTVIDYPVLYHEGDDRYNQYYIHRNYKKESSEYGSIFIDYRSTDSTDSRNVIMHGHDMLDGSMFAGMLKYSPKGDLKGDIDYYREHPLIIFNTPDGDAKYKIISMFKTSTRYEHGEFFNYMQGEFNSDAEFMNFIYNVRVRSFFDIPVTCNEEDEIITLSTCCYEFYQWRCVIVARKVRPNEDESVDVELASINPSPLFPDVYYQRYGGKRPETETFKSANKKGEIDWYDGKGDLEGSEDLTATIAANPTEPPTEKPKKGATEPPNYVYYPVTYRNYDGSQYAAYNIKEGDAVPIPDGKPAPPPDDDYYTYVFDGWDRDIDGVDFSHLNVGVDVYPKFKAVLKE